MPSLDTDTFFFFQAEDGIRDTSVTGVQTCALPIYYERCSFYTEGTGTFFGGEGTDPDVGQAGREQRVRSEERRVGKECRSGWSPFNEKKKMIKERSLDTPRHARQKAIAHTTPMRTE